MIRDLDIKLRSRASHTNKTWYLQVLIVIGLIVSSITNCIAPLDNHEVIPCIITGSISGWVWTDFIHIRKPNKVASLRSKMPSH